MESVTEQPIEHTSRVEAAHVQITRELYELAEQFGKNSEQKLLVRQAETEDWDLARRLTLRSQFIAELEKQKNQKVKNKSD